MVDLSVYGKLKSFSDYQDAANKNMLANAIAQAQIQHYQALSDNAARGADLPSSLQVANEFTKRLNAGDVAGAKQIAAFAKVADPNSLVPENAPTGLAGGIANSLATQKPAMVDDSSIAAPSVSALAAPSVAKPVVLSGGFSNTPIADVAPKKSTVIAPPVKLVGEDFLNTLDPEQAKIVKGIGDGDIKSSTILSRMPAKDKFNLMSKVRTYNPNYSDNDITGIAAFNKGKQGDQVRSFNTSIEHLGTLEPLIGALGNGNMQLVNKISNSISNQFGGVPINNFETAKGIVADEIAKAVIGGVNAEKDRADLQAKLSASKSPEQLQGVVGIFKELMAGQLKSLDQQYQASTGRNDFSDRLLLPNARKEYARHAEPTSGMSASEKEESLFNARAALRKGAAKAAVKQRLLDAGIDPKEAGL